MNIPLLIFDLLCVPITSIRICLIYWYGSKYNIPHFQVLDVLLHADNPYFNQMKDEPTIDTIKDDIKQVILEDTKNE